MSSYEKLLIGDYPVRVGCLIRRLVSTVKEGEPYLVCNGALVSRTAYAALFSAISTRYGVGDGSTTFALPDARGRFQRAFSDGATIDPDKATRTDSGGGYTGDNIGTKQAMNLPSHVHNETSGVPRQYFSGGGVSVSSESVATGTPASVTAEVRPLNTSVVVLIRYR